MTVQHFLQINGFNPTKENQYTNGVCIVTLEKDHYVVQVDEGERFSQDLNIYWLIGVLTYYNLINKNYKTI